MGIYDRDYYREQQPGIRLRGPRTIVGWLILANVVVFLANALLTGQGNQIAYWLSVRGDTLSRPWLWWQLVTYGFVHDPGSFSHILFNMLGLWFFGRPVEGIYGPKEFLRLYLAVLLLGSLVWAPAARLTGVPVSLMGASGAVVGILILFVYHFPRRTVLLMFLFPMPAWVLGVLLVAQDLYTVHLTGAAFAALYYRFGWRLSGLLAFRLPRIRLRRRPKLRLHNPGRREIDLSAEVDQILDKINRSGEASLTREERRTLEEASREFRRRRG
jgi:membrane associated rhomboid family serine protease